MASYDAGKGEVIAYIMELNPQRILDVGACDGKWAKMLRGAGFNGSIDAVERFKPNAVRIMDLYDDIYVGSIASFGYRPRKYDVVIFGDVVEHMDVKAAQNSLEYARFHASEVIVGVPYRYFQGELYGNPYERHIQDDLTHELFMERYPGFELFLQPKSDYAYYRLKKGATL